MSGDELKTKYGISRSRDRIYSYPTLDHSFFPSFTIEQDLREGTDRSCRRARTDVERLILACQMSFLGKGANEIGEDGAGAFGDHREITLFAFY